MDAVQPPDFQAFDAGALVPEAVSPAWSVPGGAAFAYALAHAPLPRQSLRALEPHAPSASPLLEQLAVHIENVERTRIEGNRLPERIAEAHAAGVGSAGIAIAMHRQARLMAAYQLDVLWSAKIVGTAAASLKQLIAAS